MRTQHLSNVTCRVFASYGKTARNAIKAYRVGGERVIGLVQQRWNRSLRASRAKLGTGVAHNANTTQARLQKLAQTSLALTANSADRVVNTVVHLADTGVHMVADNALWLEDKLGTQALSRLSQLALPAASTLQALAARVEGHSAKLVSKVAGQPARKPAGKPARVAVRQTAKTAAARA